MQQFFERCRTGLMLVAGLLLAAGLLAAQPAWAQGADPATIVQKFGGKQSFSATEAVIAEAAA
ncbi:MAG: hypothetical protein ABJD38_00480, partial [Aurantimonas coralicida]